MSATARSQAGCTIQTKRKNLYQTGTCSERARFFGIDVMTLTRLLS